MTNASHHLDDGWTRVARYIRETRRQQGYRTLDEFANASKLGERVLGDLERGQRGHYRAGTLASVERCLDWAPGTIDNIRDGGAPMPREREEVLLERINDLLDEAAFDAEMKVDLVRRLVAHRLSTIRTHPHPESNVGHGDHATRPAS